MNFTVFVIAVNSNTAF